MNGFLGENPDVIVVGNGAIGHAIAFALTHSDPRIRVAIVGEAERVDAASRAAGAMLGTFGEVTAGGMRASQGATKLELSLAAARIWEDWLDAMNSGLTSANRVERGRGTFVVLNSRGGYLDSENYDAVLHALRTYEEPFEETRPEDIDGLRPAPDGRPLRAVFIPNEGFVDSSRLLAAYATLATRSENVSLWDEAVKSLIVDSGQVTGIVTTSGAALYAGSVVLAAGVHTQNLLDQIPEIAIRIPRLFSGGGTSVALNAESTFGLARADIPSHVVRTPNRSLACGLHVVPRGTGKLYVGATNYLSLVPWTAPNVSDMYFLLECAMEQINEDLVWSKLDRWYCGNRPVSIDGCPLVGAVPSLPNLWIASGTFRDGLHLSPLLARDLANRLLGKAGIIDDRFAPERPPLPTLSREQAIAEVLKHSEAAIAEHKVVGGTKVGYHWALPRWLSSVASQVYDSLDSDYVLPHEFFPLLDAGGEPMVSYFRNYYANVRKAWDGSCLNPSTGTAATRA